LQIITCQQKKIWEIRVHRKVYKLAKNIVSTGLMRRTASEQLALSLETIEHMTVIAVVTILRWFLSYCHNSNISLLSIDVLTWICFWARGSVEISEVKKCNAIPINNFGNQEGWWRKRVGLSNVKHCNAQKHMKWRNSPIFFFF